MNRKITPVNQHINSAWSRTTALYARTATMLSIGYPKLMVLYALVVEGDMTDAAVVITAGLSTLNYITQWLLCLVGALLVGIGVACEVLADLIMLAGEGTVKAATQVTGRPFPQLKVAFDCTLVVISIILSLFYLHRLVGVREGTIAAALLVGPISKTVLRVIRPLTNRIGIAV